MSGSAILVKSAKLWYSAKIGQVPTCYREMKKTWQRKRNHSPEKMALPYIKKKKRKGGEGEASSSEEEYNDGTDPTIKQQWYMKRFQDFFDLKKASGKPENIRPDEDSDASDAAESSNQVPAGRNEEN